MAKTFYILTFGCQMNEYDSEVLESLLAGDGYIATDKPEMADLAIVNTCSVRQKAEVRALARISQLTALKSRNAKLKVVVAGCMAKRAGEDIIAQNPAVDYVVGSDYMPEIPSIIKSGQTKRVYIDEKTESSGIAGITRPNRVTAFIAISRGCENYCSYCIVPYVRGSLRSRPLTSIKAEMNLLLEMGAKDITLLGQNVNSYQDDGLDFPSLLHELGDNNSMRLRFMTSHPKDMSEKLIACFGKIPALCNGLHLPLQAGSDKVLAAMNRGYSASHYLGLIERLRKASPGISLSTDLIVGFPGETEADFQKTLDLVRQIEYDSAFMFRYSIRPGTKAAEFEDDVPETIKIERLSRLIEIQQEISARRNSRFLGRNIEVLIEKQSRREPHYPQGKTTGGQTVLVTGGDKLKSGDLVLCRIEKTSAKSLFGKFGKIA